MANSVGFRGITTGFKNCQFLKTSSRKVPVVHKIGLATSTKKKPNVTLKKRKKFYVSSSSSSNNPKPGDFPLLNWWLQKNAEVAYEFGKSLIIWVLSTYYKNLKFEQNLPFTTGDLIEVKANGDSVLGVVEEIGEKMTRMRAFDNVPHHIPNDDLESKKVKNLTFFTIPEDCPLKCCVGKVKSEKQVVTKIALWGLSFSFQISYKATKYVEKMLVNIRDEITGCKDVKAHSLVSVSIDSYLSDKQKFVISVACFVDAKMSSEDYSKIKNHLQMKLADKVCKYEKGIKKSTYTVI